MSLLSMTGFSRNSGELAPWRWTWEIKTVNARGLDLRVRAPSGFDRIEPQARASLGKRLGRGACYATLSVHRDAAAQEVRVNEAALNALCEALDRLPKSGNLRPASLDGLLAVRGVVEVIDSADSEQAIEAVAAAALVTLDAAIEALVDMRRGEGQALAAVLSGKLDAIAALTRRAEECPGRQPAAVRARLERSIAELADASPALDPVRLHQEALLLAAKADVREELDRLVAHTAAARALFSQTGPVGRRLDFLAQELAREANTLCAKSSDAHLTAIGMELRATVEQFREQVQNIE